MTLRSQIYLTAAHICIRPRGDSGFMVPVQTTLGLRNIVPVFGFSVFSWERRTQGPLIQIYRQWQPAWEFLRSTSIY